MSNPFPSQVRKALKNWGSSDVMSAYSVAVKSAAAFFTDRYRDCDECRGSGVDDLDHELKRVAGHLLGEYGPICRHCGTDHVCAICLGGGAVPTDEAVEVVAKVWLPTMWWQFGADEGWGKESWDGASEAMRDSARDHARAALIALYMMEK